MPGTRVLVAMSGGVDSGVAAARLHHAGYDVVGVTLHLWDYPDEGDAKAHGRCCAPEDQVDARRVADFLGFQHYTFDRRSLFEEHVVGPFVEAYASGVTPSPCTACNRTVKLRELIRIADRLGAEHIATGHYARMGRDEVTGKAFLRRGADGHKDQSYFLYATPEVLLERLMFPLGDSHKPEVRAEAVALGLPGAAKGESQELCFVGQGAQAYARFVEERLETTPQAPRRRPGPILDAAGNVLGHHDGVHRFTIGQRKGLGVALGKPAFVTAIDGERVVLGDGDALLAGGAVLDDLVLAPGVSLPFEGEVRVRYRHHGAKAWVQAHPEGAEVRFAEGERAVTRGQIAVLYQGDRVLGGGRIARSLPLRSAEAGAQPVHA